MTTRPRSFTRRSTVVSDVRAMKVNEKKVTPAKAKVTCHQLQADVKRSHTPPSKQEKPPEPGYSVHEKLQKGRKDDTSDAKEVNTSPTRH